MSGEARPRDWDAATYDRVADPQEAWGREVLDRLDLRGDETVLDAGCGSGRVTALLLERLPRGRVIGVDASPAMIERARERLGERAELVVRDLLELDLDAEVDAIFSSATFHWIRDHARLFERLAAAMRPGGRMEAQCGGIGNVAEFIRTVDAVSGDERFAAYLRGVHDAWNFASPEDTEVRLKRAGLVDVSCWLEPRPEAPADARGYLESVCLGPHLERMPEELREPFVTAVLESQMRPLTLDYVRLNLSATRAAGG